MTFSCFYISYLFPNWDRGWILHEQNHQWGKSQDHHCTAVAETKTHGSRPCNCKIHKRGWGNRAKTIHQICGKRAKWQLCQKWQGSCKDPNQGQQQGQQFYGKRKQPFPQRPYLSSQEASKSTIKIGSQLTQTPVWNVVTLITDKDFLVLPASFKLRCVIELDISYWDAWPNQKQSTKSTFRKKLTPWMPGKPKVMQTPSTSARYKSNNRHNSRTPKGSASTCMLPCHSQAGTTTKTDLPSCPYWPMCRCQSYVCVSVQVPNWGQKTPKSNIWDLSNTLWQCTQTTQSKTLEVP